MEFLANENIPLSTVKLIRKNGHTVFSVSEKMSGASDKTILTRAHEAGQIILTFDRDYGELIFKHQAVTPQGLVHFRFDPKHPEEPGKVLLACLHNENINLEGKYTVLERNRIRQRPLNK